MIIMMKLTCADVSNHPANHIDNVYKIILNINLTISQLAIVVYSKRIVYTEPKIVYIDC